MEEISWKRGALYVALKVVFSVGFFLFVIWYSHTVRIGPMLIMGGLGFFLVYLTARFLYHLALLPFRRNMETFLKLLNFFVRCLCIVLVIMLMIDGSRMFDATMKRDVERFAVDLETYKQTHGKYPEELKEAVVDIPSCPGLHGFPYGYDYSAAEDRYFLSCPGDGFMKHIYSSKYKSWNVSD